MRKIPPEYENPIDNIFYDLVDPTLPIFYNMNFTPNGLTTLSLLFGLSSCYFLYNKQFVPFAIMYIISYYLDFMDGAYARKYKMTSEFGDWYDHIKDNGIGLLLLYVLYKKHKLTQNMYILFVILFSFALVLLHLGCQEKMYGKNESVFLSFNKKLCPAHTKEELEQIMPYTRYIGNGTFVLILIISICVLMNKNNK